MTGAGMMECKKALVEAEGDLDAAVDVLRTRGLAAVAKKAGRATNEGTVMAIVSDDATSGAVVELNCETDFVGMNDKFKAYAERIAKAALASKPADLEALKAADAEGETVEAVVTDAGMMECKKALVEADGDMEKAVDVLRTRGLAAAAKKAGRATNEGTVMTVLADDAKSAAVVELNCETDFVGMNE